MKVKKDQIKYSVMTMHTHKKTCWVLISTNQLKWNPEEKNTKNYCQGIHIEMQGVTANYWPELERRSSSVLDSDSVFKMASKTGTGSVKRNLSWKSILNRSVRSRFR